MFKELYRRVRNRDVPVFNLEVERDRIFSECRKVDHTGNCIGEFIVYNSGRLEHGRDNNLHCFTADIGYGDDYLHLNGNVIGINHNTEPPSLNAKFEIPRFTLGGFYATHSLLDRENTLVTEIQKFNQEFEFNSIARYDRTKTKLLENAYRKYVSDQ